MSLDQLLTDDHPARLVWAYVESLDLSELYQAIRAVEGHVGRDPIDPKILVALWLYATIDGVGSAPTGDANPGWLRSKPSIRGSR